MESSSEFSDTPKPQEHEVNTLDQVFLDAIEAGGYLEESLRAIDPLLWAYGKTGQALELYPTQVDASQLMSIYVQSGQYEWPPEVKQVVLKALQKAGLM